MKNSAKIVVVNSHPITYFTTLYRYISLHPDIDLHVVYLSDMGLSDAFDTGFNQGIAADFDLLKGYSYEFCGKNYLGLVPGGFFSIRTMEIWKIIRISDADVVWLHGYNYFSYIVAFVAAIFSRKKIFFRCETHGKLKRGKVRKVLRDSLLKFYFKFVDAFLAIGSLNFQYYLSLGVPNEKITLVPYVVDNKHFSSVRFDNLKKLEALEKIEGLDKNLPTVLYCAKFIKRKHPELVLHALQILCERRCPVNVIMAGNGPELQDMRVLADQLELDNIVFLGFVGQSSLPKLYAMCDLFVHPSEDEPWGLVINEVMAGGMPVLLARDLGCAADLLIEGVNGFTLPELSANCLADHIALMLADPKKLVRMGMESRAIMECWNHEKCLKGIVKALKDSGIIKTEI